MEVELSQTFFSHVVLSSSVLSGRMGGGGVGLVIGHYATLTDLFENVMQKTRFLRFIKSAAFSSPPFQ